MGTSYYGHNLNMRYVLLGNRYVCVMPSGQINMSRHYALCEGRQLTGINMT